MNILKTTVLGGKKPINCFGKALNKGDLLREISIQWKYNAKKTWEKKHKKIYKDSATGIFQKYSYLLLHFKEAKTGNNKHCIIDVGNTKNKSQVLKSNA